VLADAEFAPVKSLIDSIPGGPILNLASTNEHVPEIERRIGVVKERCRATRHSLSFERIPKFLTIHISATFSPKTILSGETLDYKRHLCLQIGQYCQVHEADTPRNSQPPRTKGAISLGSSGRLQGGFRYMGLSSGKKIVRRSWDAIPMPDTVIARVNTLGCDQASQLAFTDRHGRLVGDSDEATDNDLPIDDLLLPDDATQTPGVDVQLSENEYPQLDMQPSDAPPIPGVDEQPTDAPPIPGVDGDNTPNDTPPIPGVDGDNTQPNNPPQITTPNPATIQREAMENAQHLVPALRRSVRTRNKPTTYTPSMSGSNTPTP
jgi:hypothetical protein